MNNRYLGALLLSPLFLFLFIGGEYLRYLIMILSLLGLYEFYKVIKVKGINPLSIVGYIICIVYYMNLNNTSNYKISMLLIVGAAFLLLCVPVVNLKYNFIDIALTLFGIIYVVIFFSFIVLINEKHFGNYLIWLVFISSWGCDTTAYYSGKLFGKRKLCPEISPKKTIEGSIGGMIGAIIGCTIFGLYVISKGFNFSLFNFSLIGALCGIFGQLGDLVASSIKRFAGVKDYSKLIPGHGGILDRFDSILFSSVVVYYYVTLVMGIV